MLQEIFSTSCTCSQINILCRFLRHYKPEVHSDTIRRRYAKMMDRQGRNWLDWDRTSSGPTYCICLPCSTHTDSTSRLGDQHDVSWGSEHVHYGAPSLSRKRASCLTEHILQAACSFRMTHSAERAVHPRVQRLHRQTLFHLIYCQLVLLVSLQ